MTAIVQSMALILLFETRFVQVISSDVTVGKRTPDAGALEKKQKEFKQKVAKEAKTDQKLGPSFK